LVQHFDLGRRSAITFPEPEAMDLDNVIMVWTFVIINFQNRKKAVGLRSFLLQPPSPNEAMNHRYALVFVLLSLNLTIGQWMLIMLADFLIFKKWFILLLLLPVWFSITPERITLPQDFPVVGTTLERYVIFILFSWMVLAFYLLLIDIHFGFADFIITSMVFEFWFWQD
jgi:hypothetical protein